MAGFVSRGAKPGQMSFFECDQCEKKDGIIAQLEKDNAEYQRVIRGYRAREAKSNVKRRETMEKVLKQFVTYHLKNPHVWTGILTFFRNLRDGGREHYSMKTVIERLRQDTGAATRAQTDDEYKLNNNYVPIYSRLLQQQHPNLAEMLDYRRCMFDDIDLVKALQWQEEDDQATAVVPEGSLLFFLQSIESDSEEEADSFSEEGYSEVEE